MKRKVFFIFFLVLSFYLVTGDLFSMHVHHKLGSMCVRPVDLGINIPYMFAKYCGEDSLRLGFEFKQEISLRVLNNAYDDQNISKNDWGRVIIAITDCLWKYESLREKHVPAYAIGTVLAFDMKEAIFKKTGVRADLLFFLIKHFKINVLKEAQEYCEFYVCTRSEKI